MATFTIPASNWLTALADAVEKAKEGDIIIVASEAAAELARRAAERAHKNVVIRVAPAGR